MHPDVFASRPLPQCVFETDYAIPGKMGTAQDPMAVVDSDHRVFGVRNLRVVDVSSFPFLVPGHPQSTVCKSSHCFIFANVGESFTDVLSAGQHHQPLLCNCIPCGYTFGQIWALRLYGVSGTNLSLSLKMR